jgi:tRNA U34 5-carboxymethylaminomethyl modifying GTPase MnmE/TrmE
MAMSCTAAAVAIERTKGEWTKRVNEIRETSKWSISQYQISIGYSEHDRSELRETNGLMVWHNLMKIISRERRKEKKYFCGNINRRLDYRTEGTKLSILQNARKLKLRQNRTTYVSSS